MPNFELIMALLRYGLDLLFYLILLGLAGFCLYLAFIRVFDYYVKASSSQTERSYKRRNGGI